MIPALSSVSTGGTGIIEGRAGPYLLHLPTGSNITTSSSLLPLPNIFRHISNENAYPIYPLNPCDGLHPFVSRCCSDFQNTISPAGSCDLPSPGLAFNLCIGFEMLAQQVNIADCDHQV